MSASVLEDDRTFDEVSKSLGHTKLVQFVGICEERLSTTKYEWHIKCDLFEIALNAIKRRLEDPYAFFFNESPGSRLGLSGAVRYALPWRDVFEQNAGFLRGSTVWLADAYFKAHNASRQERIVREYCRIQVLGELTGWASWQSITPTQLGKPLIDHESYLSQRNATFDYTMQNIFFSGNSHKSILFSLKEPLCVEAFAIAYPFEIDQRKQRACFTLWGQMHFRRRGKKGYEFVPKELIEDQAEHERFWKAVDSALADLRSNPDLLAVGNSPNAESLAIRVTDIPEMPDENLLELADRTRLYPQKQAAKLIGIGYTTLRDDKKRAKRKYPVQYVGESTRVTGASIRQMQIDEYCSGKEPHPDQIFTHPSGKTYLRV